MKAGTWFTPEGFAWIRLLSWVAVVAFAVVTFLVFAEISRRRPLIGSGHSIHVVVAAAACLALPMLPGVFRYFDNFNNYPFEALYLALAVCFALWLDRSSWAWWAFLATIGVAPFFVIGPLLALPALIVRAGSYAWAHKNERPRLMLQLGAACLIAACVAAAMYLGLYARLTSADSVAGFWANDSLPNGLRDLPHQMLVAWRQMGAQIVDAARFDGTLGLAVSALAVAAFVVGAWEISRRWPWYLAALACGWFLTIPAALVAGWPVTAVRVNFAFVAMAFALTTFGFFRIVQWLAGLIPGERIWPAVICFGVVFALMLPAPIQADTSVFARGLRADLAPIAESPSNDNVVLSYHFKSHFYPHDLLINFKHGDRSYVIVREERGDQAIYDDVDEIVAENLRPGGILWCIVPNEPDREKMSKACRFDNPNLAEVWRSNGSQADIIGYELTED